MGFADSYLGRLRETIGHALVLLPGAIVTVQRSDGAVLFVRRADDGSWCLPGGAAEPGGSFARAAVAELAEETGLTVRESDLIAFGSLSEAERHTVTYPNGDVIHSFTLCFFATTWGGEPHSADEETTEVRFADPTDPPRPLHPAHEHALRLLLDFRAGGGFQTR